MIKYSLTVALIVGVLNIVNVQVLIAQSNSVSGWGSWFSSYRIPQSAWGIHHDVQLRSGRDFKRGVSLLVRPGLNYHMSARDVFSMGYAATVAVDRKEGRSIDEHRIWEQYTRSSSLFNVATQHRFRLEQRFLYAGGEEVFSQRARYFVRSIIPLSRQQSLGFSEGLFSAVQNEVFFNIHNPETMNKRFFDQNRFYTSLGYRFRKKYDVEIGYLNQFVYHANVIPNSFNHVVQTALYTRF